MIDGSLGLELAGEGVELLARRALWWPARRTLLVADLHLGKEDVFRAGGIPIPGDATGNDLAALTSLANRVNAGELVVLGDFFHGPESRSPGVHRALVRWREALGPRRVTLVRGNHDRAAGDPPGELELRVVEGPWRLGPFVLRHEPTGDAGAQGPGRGRALRERPGYPGEGARGASLPSPSDPDPGYEIAGHLHPAVRLEGRGRDRLRLPCFWVRPTQCILPAFGGLTGSGRVRPRSGDRIFVVGDGQVAEVPLA